MKPARKPWKLWHFTVLVLLAAPVFGMIHALSKGAYAATEGLYAAVVVGLAGLAPLAIIRAGRRLVGPWTARLKEWSVRRDGAIGLILWIVIILLEAVFYVGSIVAAPVATIFLILWVAGRVGR